MATPKSVEEKVEDRAKQWLISYKCKFFAKTESINPEIDAAMKSAPSKKGGLGGNYPDIRLLLESSAKIYPIIIEVKGAKGKLVKLNAKNEIENKTQKGEPNYNNIDGFAVNGAVHYSQALINYTMSYNDVIAIGINGYMEAGALTTELGVYYISADNYSVPKKVGEFADLSFLAQESFHNFINQVEQLKLTPEELDIQSRKIEEQIEISLKNLNQSMQDDLQISVGSRVELITGMIMAGLGVDNKVAPLEISDLKGQTGKETNDGKIIISRISDFLTERELPQEKREMLINDLSRVFIHSGLYNPHNGESKLKTVYSRVKTEIIPIFVSAHHLDFTGKLFNVLNEWVDIPDSDRNDVVLTPRYVTSMMAKLAKVDRNSYVWDYAAGSAGFLISAMNLMIEDAKRHIKSPDELDRTLTHIKMKQLLGIEKRPDIYLLAVLNMIIMGDGSSNILHKNSLTDYSGNYEWGDEKDKPFPANVFLLNPPYSAEGKGFIFVKKALSRMKSGRAVILVQENAGSGNGLPFTKDILSGYSVAEKNDHGIEVTKSYPGNTLVASIHMADVFRGKAGVQTAVYVFEVGKTHDEKQLVRFIDMSNDGYTRQNRRRSKLDVNLRNTDHAFERYQEVVDLVNYGKNYLRYFTEDEYIEDTISLDGKDWTFSQHKKIDTIPCESDFMKVITDYLAWDLGRVLKGEQDD
ncbi:MAG: SAM-dependent methyltransferase [Oscillospiraceae bacterium]|nr:SAM-dependent methyltransferase [Oscillospiraceae bacterium]